ncbi:hypothetical protein [Paenarthrobacter sp. YIM B13468]|uniref:hypothetical protein n=1 Tax=Paenarthrobacter sp. YIM B13468 TaxID=3366295 RepID=UPI003672B8CF
MSAPTGPYDHHLFGVWGQRSPAEMNQVLTYGRQITEGLSNLQKPVVGAVNSFASGAGFNLALWREGTFRQ